MRARNLLLGAAAGFVAGYAALRTFEAVREVRRPSAPREKNAIGYGRLRRALALASIARDLAGAAATAYGPIGLRADEAMLGAKPWLRPALLVGALLAVESIAGLPIAFGEDFTIERRYGMTQQTVPDWAIDYAKGAAVSAAVTVTIGTAFAAVVRRAPRFWPLLASLGALPLLVLGSIVVPLYILPLFNRFEPLDGPLEKRLRALAARYGVGDAEILRMDMSRQTSKANAFVIGIGSTHRIVIGDTILQHFPDEEVEFVVAHELGHYVAKDTWRTIALGQGLATVLFLFARGMVGKAERQTLRDRPLLLLRFYFWMMVASQILRPALLAFSRSREWAADRFALNATNTPAVGAAAFRRLRDQNLAEDEQPAWYQFLFGSHPSLGARIAALEAAKPRRRTDAFPTTWPSPSWR
jgi:STE24 endopeptidase